jgi:hypothetical protein
MNLNEDDVLELIDDKLGVTEETKKVLEETAFEEDALSEEDARESMMYPNGRYEKTWMEKLFFWR